MSGYQVKDELYLWWLGDPLLPVFVGTLRLLRTTQGVSLQYSAEWLSNGFALSEDLPLTDPEHAPVEKNMAAGAVDDARPDRWGERVIRFIDKPPRLSLLEFLYFTGDERFGALGVSTSAKSYQPKPSGPLPRLEDVRAIHEVVRKILANEPVPEAERRLIAPGATLGGARPKALIQLDGYPWVVKFSELGDTMDVPLVEHACLTLADKARIRVVETRPIPLASGHALAVRRFDRQVVGDSVVRVHAQSAHVALRAEGTKPGYPELAQLLRRRGPVKEGFAREQMRELFRRMIFNILMDNTDDHEKNHALLMDDAKCLTLAPAFDVLPTAQALSYQQMRVGTDMADATVKNALSEVAQFGLTAKDALAEAARVAAVCENWRAHFSEAGVTDRDVAELARFIDRDFLRVQRKKLLSTPTVKPK